MNVKWHTRNKFGAKSRKKNNKRGRKCEVNKEVVNSVVDAEQPSASVSASVMSVGSAGGTLVNRNEQGPQDTVQASAGSSKKVNRAEKVMALYRNLVSSRSSAASTSESELDNISTTSDMSECNLETQDSAKSGEENIIMHMGSFNKMLSFLKCPKCNAVDVVNATYGRTLGLSTEVRLHCVGCRKDVGSRFSSPQNFTFENNPTRAQYEINQRAVLAMKTVGLGHIGLGKIFGVMNIVGGLHHKTYSHIADNLHSTLRTVLSTTLLDAHSIVRSAYIDLDQDLVDQEVIDIAASYDGSWHRRRTGSIYGVGFTIDALTGLVTDYDVRSKYCHECAQVGSTLSGEDREKWVQIHKSVCDKNYDGPVRKYGD